MAMRLRKDDQIFFYIAKFGNTQSFLNIRTKLLECVRVCFSSLLLFNHDLFIIHHQQSRWSCLPKRLFQPTREAFQ
jgi:hypothetical protein